MINLKHYVQNLKTYLIKNVFIMKNILIGWYMRRYF